MLRCENGGALHSLGMLACEAATDPQVTVVILLIERLVFK